MTQMHTSLNDIFNLPEHKAVEVLPAVTSTPIVNESDEDFEYARSNLRKMIEQGQSALETAFDLAKTSESPRAFEVASGLVKTLSDANKDLLELRKKNKELNDNKDTRAPTTVNNQLFVGSTTELQQLLKKNKELK